MVLKVLPDFHMRAPDTTTVLRNIDDMSDPDAPSNTDQGQNQHGRAQTSLIPSAVELNTSRVGRADTSEGKVKIGLQVEHSRTTDLAYRTRRTDHLPRSRCEISYRNPWPA